MRLARGMKLAVLELHQYDRNPGDRGSQNARVGRSDADWHPVGSRAIRHECLHVFRPAILQPVLHAVRLCGSMQSAEKHSYR